MEQPDQFTALGKADAVFTQLDVFECPEHLVEVVLSGDELTAFCPITNQPDFYQYRVRYEPVHLCIESKSFKLFISSFRERQAFAEALASEIAVEVNRVTRAETEVTLTQSIRGGISITARAVVAANPSSDNVALRSSSLRGST